MKKRKETSSWSIDHGTREKIQTVREHALTCSRRTGGASFDELVHLIDETLSRPPQNQRTGINIRGVGQPAPLSPVLPPRPISRKRFRKEVEEPQQSLPSSEQDKPAKRLRTDPFHVILRINDSQRTVTQPHLPSPAQEGLPSISPAGTGPEVVPPPATPAQSNSIVIRGAASRKLHPENNPSSAESVTQNPMEVLPRSNIQHGKISITARLGGLDLRLDRQPVKPAPQTLTQKPSDLSIRSRTALPSVVNVKTRSEGDDSNQRYQSQQASTSVASKVPLMDRIHGVKPRTQSEQATSSQTIFDRLGVTKTNAMNSRASSSTLWKSKNG
ncbi:hypothetical protein CPB86DRAFT_73131 [Serendipita vermifera]|nr:hypothetical protein CPB86DRAFT_73131 [Serendipita vermifera]